MSGNYSPLLFPSLRNTDSPPLVGFRRQNGSKPGTPRSVTFDLPGRPSPTTEVFENISTPPERPSSATSLKRLIIPSPDTEIEMREILEEIKTTETVYMAELRELQTYVNLYGNAYRVLESIREVHRMFPNRIDLLEDWVGY